MDVKKKEKEKLAVALKYDKDENRAPQVIAKGSGQVAENIIKKGEEEGITSLENKGLAKDLFKLDINEEIPEELYTAVAEILNYVYKLDNKEKSLYE